MQSKYIRNARTHTHTHILFYKVTSEIWKFVARNTNTAQEKKEFYNKNSFFPSFATGRLSCSIVFAVMLFFTHFHLWQWQLIFHLLANLCSARFHSTTILFVFFLCYPQYFFVGSFIWYFPCAKLRLFAWNVNDGNTLWAQSTIAISPRCFFTGFQIG